MEKKEALKPCPFCGSEAVGIDTLRYRRGKSVMHRAVCKICEASSRYALTAKAAVYIWNRRGGGEALESSGPSYKPWQRLVYL